MKPSQLTVLIVAANAANPTQSAVQQKKASLACLVQKGSMSANMFSMNICALACDDPLSTPDYASSSSSDGQVNMSIPTKRKREKKRKLPVENKAELMTPVTAVGADSPANSAHHVLGQLEERSPLVSG
jgi:hypothetical protein